MIDISNSEFAHLHVHSEKSLLDGYGSAKAYVGRAKEMGFKYIACTDHGNIDSLLQWQGECDKTGILPVLGVEAYIVPDRHIKQKEKRGHITIWVKNQQGWKTLCGLLTDSNLTGFYYRPRIDYNLLLSCKDLSGLIVGTACAGSFLNLPGSNTFLRDLSSKTDVYFEIMPHDIDSQKVIHSKIKKLKTEFPSIPFVATNDCHYILKDEWEAQEMLLAIQSRAKWKDPKRWTFGFKGLHLRNADEMVSAFEEQDFWEENIVREAMSNTVSIAQQCCDFRIEKREMSLPRPPGLSLKKNEPKILEDICQSGYKKIFGKEWDDEYKKRYQEEISLICDKKFERYFLIVYDVINWARENGIMVGPGRGSAAGSLVSYLMGITQVDPIEFGLSFSRFLNESRQDYPDIDIDFEKIHREEVVGYLKNAYGEHNTCGISTDMKMQSKGAIRDVCRVMEVPSDEVSAFAGSIFKSDNSNSLIQESINKTREGKAFSKKYPKATELALKMEGQCRGKGAHAAGIIVSNDDLSKSDRCVLVKRNKKIVCNWSKKDSEYSGLMKLDILGLSTLSVLSYAKSLINKQGNKQGFYYRPESQEYLFINVMARELNGRYKNCQEVEFDFNKIPLNDKKTFKTLSNKETSGIFQLSGWACSELCQKMGIHSFNDIVAVTALARPGPADSGITEEYVERKHGKKWEKKHPMYEEITKNTYGVIVYQEQIMAVIAKVAGLSDSVADKIRKIISKKRSTEEFKPFWERFKKGCADMGTLDEQEAEEFWDEMQKHASYSFNLSHSVSYALIGYWTAYLKTHCQREFYCGSLTYGESEILPLLEEIRGKGYNIITPKIKYSDSIKWTYNDRSLYMPFVEIDGVGEKGAIKCMSKKQKTQRVGFFGKDFAKPKTTKIEKMLSDLLTDCDDLPDSKIIRKYLPHVVDKRKSIKWNS